MRSLQPVVAGTAVEKIFSRKFFVLVAPMATTIHSLLTEFLSSTIGTIGASQIEALSPPSTNSILEVLN
ncbi:MAG TPA: hypothetical protein VGO61_01400 [Steroidobacteraceae bacterium]|nr:hypothetical protein [Steroidobacteraceae bacterium]